LVSKEAINMWLLLIASYYLTKKREL